MKSIYRAAILGLAFAALVFSQTALTSTTFSQAVAVADTEIYVASATGISAPSSGASLASVLIAGPEAMKVLAVSGTKISVQRGWAGRVTKHASGDTVYEGQAAEFANVEPYGPCTAGTDWAYTPLIVPGTGNTWTCTDSVWKQNDSQPDPVVSANVGTPGTSVTAVEYGDGRHHVTKLTFSGVTVVAPTGVESLAGGYKIYTLPAGAAVVHSASMSVALTGSGATCDADTPDLGIGTVIGSGAVAVLGGTATFEDILTGQTADDCNGTAELKTLSQGLGVETAGAHTVHVNAADAWAGACTITAAGTVWLEWSLLD